MVAGPLAIEYFIENQDQFPKAQACHLGPVYEMHSIDEYSLLVQQAVKDGRCSAGTYALDGLVFSVDASSAALLWPIDEPTPTPFSPP
jgi:hypothetical protein